MNKHFAQNISRFLLLIVIGLSSGCGQSTVTDSPTSTSINVTKTQKPVSTTNLLPTATPIYTKSISTSTPLNISASPTSVYYSVPTQSLNTECLPPLTNFAFPVGVINNLGNITSRPTTLPSGSWQVQTSLPDTFDFYSGKITVTTNGDIWIKGSIHFGEDAYFVYNPNGKEEIYLEEYYGKAYKYYIPEAILQTKDGTLWGVGTSYGNTYEPWEYQNSKPLISRFNKDTGKFEYIENILSDFRAYSRIADVKLDNEENIWLLINYSDSDNLYQTENIEIPTGLYRFNTNSQKADYFLIMPKDIVFTRFAPVQDGSIWILGYQLDLSKQTILLKYIPKTGELRTYDGTFSYVLESEDFLNLDISPYSPLFLDSTERLWVSNEGWLEKLTSQRPSWYRIIQDPAFITAGIDGVGNFSRARPFGISESSDGMFWFWGAGTVRLNPEIGEWCLFTTYSSPVVEDNDHNLWMVADNKLYKYKLGQ